MNHVAEFLLGMIHVAQWDARIWSYRNDISKDGDLFTADLLWPKPDCETVYLPGWSYNPLPFHDLYGKF